MNKVIFACIAAALVTAPLATVVQAEETTVIRDRDRDSTVIKAREGDGDRTVVKKREELHVLPVPHTEEKTIIKKEHDYLTRQSFKRPRNLGFYLPSYSPDFNPIEQFFAKLKALLRKVAARTIEALIAAIAEALTKVSSQECKNYLANQGYRCQL